MSFDIHTHKLYGEITGMLYDYYFALTTPVGTIPYTYVLRHWTKIIDDEIKNNITPKEFMKKYKLRLKLTRP